jgi:prefoldin alpha subunit
MDQEKYQEMQMLDYQIKQMQKLIENIDAQLFEIGSTVDALQEFERLENNDEVLFPVANGIFAKGRLTDNKMLKVNVGSNVVTEKTVKDTVEMMQKQAEDIGNYKREVVGQLQKFISKIQELEK